MLFSKHKFSEEAKEAIRLINKTNHNIFITGKAGTGKSTLLEYVRNNIKKMVVLAPTGIAAINVNGDTIHSFFKLKPGFEKDEAQKMKINEDLEKKYKSLKTIAIDEISMVRADLLDAVDIVLRRGRKDSRPFGGVQMVFFGDMYQLPPVVTPADRDKFNADYESPYFFSAAVFRGQNDLFSGKFDLKIVELKTIYRQRDADFINILNAVRDKSVTSKHFLELNKRYNPDFEPERSDNYIYLMTTNANAKKINDAKLRELKGKAACFKAFITGKVASNLYPNDTTVKIKPGAQVMFIQNDPERRWVNGTIGKVTKISRKYDEDKDTEVNEVTVKKNDGKIVKVTEYEWEISRYIFEKGKFKRDIMGSFTQIPMKLAWAITIHKSQGKTFEKVIIDLGWGSFAHGQTYVALSRCTSLGGIVLKQRINHRSIIMDRRVQEFGV